MAARQQNSYILLGGWLFFCNFAGEIVPQAYGNAPLLGLKGNEVRILDSTRCCNSRSRRCAQSSVCKIFRNLPLVLAGKARKIGMSQKTCYFASIKIRPGQWA